MKKSHQVFACLCGAMALLPLSRTALAESPATEIYSDAKDLTIDLIESEVAKSGASLLMCRSPEFLSYYFASTIQTMRKPPLDLRALGKTARTDAATFAGDWVRQSVEVGQLRKLSELEVGARTALQNPSGLGDIRAKCAKEPNEEGNKDLQAIIRQFLEYRQNDVPPPLAGCSSPYGDDVTFDSKRAISCEVGLAVRAALLSDAQASQAYLVGALMVPATVRIGGNYAKWSELKDTMISLLQAAEERFDTDVKNAFPTDNGLPLLTPNIQEQLRVLAKHFRTTVKADGSMAALQQTLVSALEKLKVGLKDNEIVHVNQALEIIGSPQFLRFLEAIKSGDGHRIVLEAIDTGSLVLAQPHAENLSDNQRAGISAALAVLRYATEEHANKTASESTREAAKAALFTYLSENGKGGYTSARRHFGGIGFEILTLSVGASFSPGYVNSDVQGLRTPVSAEAVVLKFALSQRNWSYTGIHLSALNLLGYPAEVVLRDPKTSFGNERASHILGLTLHPRADLVFGVPAFSRKLALFVGAGFTTVAPIKTTDGSYTYASLFHHRPGNTSGEFGPRFVDVSAGIRFYPF